MKGYPPSVREIGEAVGLASSSTVHGHLSRLEEKGYIERSNETTCYRNCGGGKGWVDTIIWKKRFMCQLLVKSQQVFLLPLSNS